MHTRTICLLSLIPLAACAAPTGDEAVTQSDALSAAPVNGILLPPPPPPETPTTLTFFENANFTGASYSVSINPSASEGEFTRVVPWSEITAHGLSGKVSAVRLACGTRPSRVSLFDIDWSEFASGDMLECDPNQTASLPLTSDGYDNRIDSAALVVHARSSDNRAHSTPFSGLLSAVWRQQMTQLPSGAATQGAAKIWLESFDKLRIHQAFTLDSTWCSKRDAEFELQVWMSTVNFQPVFDVIIASEYVSYGFGDAWGCHDAMLKALDGGARDAVTKLEAGLPQLYELLGVQNGKPLPSSTHYFAPTQTTTDFDAFQRE